MSATASWVCSHQPAEQTLRRAAGSSETGRGPPRRVRVRLASCGPRPSCRSRRSRRRSSSRARHQPLARALQVRGEADGLLAQASACAATPIWRARSSKQPPVPGREGLLTGAAAEHQLTDGFAAVEQRQAHRIGHRFADSRPPRSTRPLRRVRWRRRAASAPPHRPDDGRQHGVGGERGFQALAQAGDAPRRARRARRTEMVDGSLQPAAQRLEEHRDQPAASSETRSFPRICTTVPDAPTTST